MQSALDMRETDVCEPPRRRYALVVTECQSEECEGVPVYGIRVSDGEEHAEVLDLSSDRVLVEKLLTKICCAGDAPDRAILLELAEDYLEELQDLR